MAQPWREAEVVVSGAGEHGVLHARKVLNRGENRPSIPESLC